VSNSTLPFGAFNFELHFTDKATAVNICAGAFSECSGLEGTMEPKVIKEGGRNYGAVQLAGNVTFATVVLKRGISLDHSLYQWFAKVTLGDRANYGYRLNVEIAVKSASATRDTFATWALERALPVKLKVADLNARGTEIGIEELHLAHEGLTLKVTQ
jgi:phage tail-like protein